MESIMIEDKESNVKDYKMKDKSNKSMHGKVYDTNVKCKNAA